uniref:hypothetical protein n=1 Tax=Salmonella sp. s55004 TaxID=3159675 RepID=UPI0039819191
MEQVINKADTRDLLPEPVTTTDPSILSEDQQELEVTEEPWAAEEQPVYRVHQDHQVNLVLLDNQVDKAQEVKMVMMDKMVATVPLVLPVQQEHRELQATVDAQDVQDAVGTKASMDSLVHEEEREIKVVAVKMVPMVLVEPLAPKVLPELVVELV